MDTLRHSLSTKHLRAYARAANGTTFLLLIPLYTFSFVFATALSGTGHGLAGLLLLVLGEGAAIWFTVRIRRFDAAVDKRIKAGAAIKVPNLPAVAMNSFLADSAFNTQIKTVVRSQVVEADPNDWANWCIYDVVDSGNTPRENGSGPRYYTIFQARLVRQLPHVVFDSKQANGSQFKTVYAQTQRLSLEGNFDTYFDTYVPETYNIDTLSFITPEVMEELLAARGYDIELVDNKLFCFGPLTALEDLAEFRQIGLRLQAGLNDNVKTYKDDRLAGQARNAETTVFARSLLKNPLFELIPIAMLVAIELVACIIIAAANPQRALGPILLSLGVVTVVLIPAIIQVRHIATANKRAIAQFKQGDNPAHR
jgi:hypothetical protein